MTEARAMLEEIVEKIDLMMEQLDSLRGHL